jgi:endoglucanase
MGRLPLLCSAFGCALGIHLNGFVPQQGTDAAQLSSLPRRGVSLAGAEFGTQSAVFCNESPGIHRQHYSYSHETTVQTFCEKGVTLLRVPVRWERLQPRLGEDLNEPELRRLKNVISWARTYGAVVLDLHNFGRYALRHERRIVDARIDHPVGGTVLVSRDDFANLWSRISEALAGEQAVYAYGLMNEPHDMGQGDWKLISQTAVDAIRARNDRKLILVTGNNWSHANSFREVNGPQAWVHDPADNVAYEVHCYFDHDQSGRYEWTYDQELARDPNLEARAHVRLAPFVEWCRTKSVRGFVGEFGVPRDDPRWTTVLRSFLGALDSAGMEGCAWAAGEWWGNYQLLVTPEMLAR